MMAWCTCRVCRGSKYMRKQIFLLIACLIQFVCVTTAQNLSNSRSPITVDNASQLTEIGELQAASAMVTQGEFNPVDETLAVIQTDSTFADGSITFLSAALEPITAQKN